MLSGGHRLDDYTTVIRPTFSEMVGNEKWKRWPIMAWDVDESYWLHHSWAGPVRISAEKIKMVDVVMTSSVIELADNARFCCDWNHELLASDGSWKTLRQVVDGDLMVQHGRGVGHNVRIKSVKERSEPEHGYFFSVERFGSFCNSYIIHRAAS